MWLECDPHVGEACETRTRGETRVHGRVRRGDPRWGARATAPRLSTRAQQLRARACLRARSSVSGHGYLWQSRARARAHARSSATLGYSRAQQPRALARLRAAAPRLGKSTRELGYIEAMRTRRLKIQKGW